jgi:superfamily II DNA helicase RecQ
VDWRPVQARREQAEARIQAVEVYAQESHCRRARLVGYFGETLRRCAGCDRCGAKPQRMSRDPQVTARLSRLRAALSSQKGAWGGCPIEPRVLFRLALSPPADAAALACVPGVGAALTERMGGAILGALAPGYTTAAAPSMQEHDALFMGLQHWRADVARSMGVPPYVVLTDTVLQAVAENRPRTRAELARIRGVGPRMLAKFGSDLLRLSTPDATAPVPGATSG